MEYRKLRHIDTDVIWLIIHEYYNEYLLYNISNKHIKHISKDNEKYVIINGLYHSNTNLLLFPNGIKSTTPFVDIFHMYVGKDDIKKYVIGDHIMRKLYIVTYIGLSTENRKLVNNLYLINQL